MLVSALKKPYVIALIAATVCIGSQMVAESSLVGTGWDAFGRAIWLTILVTIPAFVTACVFGLIALVRWIRSARLS